MSTAVKTMATPMPPAEKRVQWLPPSNGGSTGNIKPNGVLNGDLPPAQKLQRPQSAVVHSMNRKLLLPSEVRNSSDSIKIAFEGGENERREIIGKFSSEARPHTSGGEGSSTRNHRPLSAMASISRGGTVSSAEKFEIEDLKREILEVAKCINNNRTELQQSDAKVSSTLARVLSVDETENALKRFITTNDPAQVQMAKNTLLCMVLQKHEELHRDILSTLHKEHGAFNGEQATRTSSNSSSSSSIGSARDRGRDGLPRSRSAVMLALVDKTKSLSSQISGMKDESMSAANQLQDAKLEIRKLTEERELLRATLTQAGRPGGGSIKMVRPVSAPRARQPSALAVQISARTAGACDGCELLEVRICETRLLLQAAEDTNQSLSEKVAALTAEKSEWQRRTSSRKAPELVHAPAAAAPAHAPAAASADQSGEMAKLKKKIADLEKSLKEKAKEAKEAKDAADAEKNKSEKLVKDNKDKDAKIVELEKLLADALARVSTLEKRLNDMTLNLKANGESTDGVFVREKELLRQIECLTKEMTQARKETGICILTVVVQQQYWN